MIDALLLGSIIFFFFLLFFLGFSLLSLFRIRLSNTWFVCLILYLGIGLGTLVFLLILFNVLGLALDYRLFFLISLLCPLHYVFTHYKHRTRFFQSPCFSVSTKEYFCYSLVLLGTLLLFVTYLYGAFAYPYLEDDDPWEHAVAVTYIAQQKTYHQETPESISHYLEPYPPSYDAVLALMYQINGSVFLTLKVFNVLFISLGVLFFFVFALALFGVEAATVATLVLVALPSSMSHFIWSHTLALVLFPITMYAAFCGFTEKKWIFVGILMTAAMMVTHPFVSVIFGVFYLVFVFWFFLHKDWTRFFHAFFIGLFGVLLSFVYWGQQLFRHGLDAILYSHTGGFGGVSQIGPAQTVMEQYINPAYSLMDFFVAPLITKIDQPTGFGVLVFVLALCAVLYLLLAWKKYFVQEKYQLVVLLWFLLTFLGLLGGHLPLSTLTHRFWAYVSIPLALLVGIFVVVVFEKIRSRFVLILLSVLLFFGLFGIPSFDAFNAYTSWAPKYAVETAQWPPGVGWSSVQELEGYMWMREHLAGSRVLSLCKEERFLLGFDLITNFPNVEMNEFRKNLATKQLTDIFERSRNYDYLSLEYSCVKNNYLTEEQLNTVANALSSAFSVLFMNDEIVVYAI